MIIDTKDYLAHHGIAGQKWGVRRYQNEDGSLTPEGREHYGYSSDRAGAKRMLKDIKKGTIKGMEDSKGAAIQSRHPEAIAVLKNRHATPEEIDGAMKNIMKDPSFAQMAENAERARANEKVNNIITAAGAATSAAGVASTILQVQGYVPGSPTIGLAITALGGIASTVGVVKSGVNAQQNMNRQKATKRSDLY